jgi:hypothetical protein
VLRDGQTVVIAGLIGDERSVEQTGVPLLMEIPWLGNLFRPHERDPQPHRAGHLRDAARGAQRRGGRRAARAGAPPLDAVPAPPPRSEP